MFSDAAAVTIFVLITIWFIAGFLGGGKKP